jgi:hypothetical protein
MMSSVHQLQNEAVIGEIRVKVILTNSTDEALNRRRKLKKSAIRRFEADALVDTGAVRSVIPAHVMGKLGVMARGQRVAEYADGRKESVGITEPIIFDVLGRDTLEEALVLGDEVLIGRRSWRNSIFRPTAPTASWFQIQHTQTSR